MPLLRESFLHRRIERRRLESPSGICFGFAFKASSALGAGGRFLLLVLDVDVDLRMLPSSAGGSGVSLYVASLAKSSSDRRSFPQRGIRVR